MTATQTLTTRASRFLDRHTSRRSFIAKTAVVGSALAVAGRDYVLRPTSAYAALCGCNGRTCDCSSLCCDGYTEFCCQIYGSNQCPPGTLLAGWWKVDNSSFCNGQARYYMDCNDTCPSGCGCGGSGVCSGSCSGARCQCRSCGNRKDGCTHFRYGNCNNHVACVGPIMCRLVSCTKPWEIESTCTTASRTDNNTRYHHRPCLDPPPTTEIDVDAAAGGFRFHGVVHDDVMASPARFLVYIDREPVQSISVADDGRFDTTIPWPPGTFEVCLWLHGTDGSERETGCRTVSRR